MIKYLFSTLLQETTKKEELNKEIILNEKMVLNEEEVDSNEEETDTNESDEEKLIEEEVETWNDVQNLEEEIIQLQNEDFPFSELKRKKPIYSEDKK